MLTSSVGCKVGALEGLKVGTREGCSVGTTVGARDVDVEGGSVVGWIVGLKVVGSTDGL